jgi:hypothetical protein
MAVTTLNIVKIFIGSPGGLQPERETAKRIIEEVNQSHSENWGCQFRLVGWEATLPGYNRAQSIINQDLDKCEYFVGVLWNEWGSKPDDGDSRYTSGFEEEYERAKEHLENGSMKDIVLFFKDIPEVQIKDSGPSVKKVIAFRDKCIEEHKLLFKEFKDPIDFEINFREKIVAIGWKEFHELNHSPDESYNIERSAENTTNSSNSLDDTKKLIESTAAGFITGLLQRSSDWDETSAQEVARFRLISHSIQRSGNSSVFLDTHDANILFAKRDEFEYSSRELRALVETGIAGFDHQNIPLWHWLLDSNNILNMKFLAIYGGSTLKPRSISIFQRMGFPSKELINTDKEKEFTESWLKGVSNLKECAEYLDFLRTNGDRDDSDRLEVLINEVGENIQNKVAQTIVGILVRLSLSDSLNKLIELNPDPIEDNIINQIFSQSKSISSEILHSCLALKSDTIRRESAKLLCARRAIDISTANGLLTDSDIEVRLQAAKSLLYLDYAPEDATLKKALIQPKLGGIFSFPSPTGQTNDDKYFKHYCKSRLSEQSYSELKRLAEESSVIDTMETLSLYKRFTKRCVSQIRSNLKDEFKQHFSTRLSAFKVRFSDNSELIQRVEKTDLAIRHKLITRTLDILCTYGQPRDIEIVRKALDSNAIEHLSEAILQYLSQYGDWSDSKRIIAMTNREVEQKGFLSINVNKLAKPIAKALYSVGKTRLVDVFSLKINTEIRCAIVTELSQTDINKFADEFLLEELNHKDDLYRKLVALRCVQSLTKTRTQKLLNDFVTIDGYRYYNSIHWLDLGSSMTREIAKSVVTFELAEFR